MRTVTILIVIAAAAVALVAEALVIARLVWLIRARLKAKKADSVDPASRKDTKSLTSWKSYLRGQGAILLGFLTIGGSLGGVSVCFGPSSNKFSRSGQLIEYHQLNPSKQVVYKENQNIKDYSRIIVFTRVTEPADGSARVAILRSDGGKSDVARIENVSSSWMRLDLENSYSEMRVIVEDPAQATALSATQVEVLLYLSP